MGMCTELVDFTIIILTWRKKEKGRGRGRRRGRRKGKREDNQYQKMA